MKYITRGQSSAEGKPTIFVAGHRDDLKLHMNFVSELFLEKVDCRVCYSTASDMGELEAEIQNLSGMRFVVFIVTRRFLTEGNSGLDCFFPAAVDNHIPVLPLMFEGGIDGLFEEKFGEMQYLCPFQKDETQVEFDKKLDDFLDKNLLKDAEKENVRKIFSKSIFLSYRQKERLFARRLIKVIHADRSLRQVPVWYDENLMGGEDYNPNIQNAIERCSLFVMAITPGIVESGNYVIRREYPDAKNTFCKPILPIECEETDREVLAASFENIEAWQMISLKDEELIIERVKDLLSIGEAAMTPEMEYLLGVAYLYGVEVETDRTIAFELISKAADAGLIKAHRKLVQMYCVGDGVKQDYRKASGHQQYVMDEAISRYKESPNSRSFANAVTEVWLYGDYLQNCHDYDSALEAYFLMKDIIEEYKQLNPESNAGTLFYLGIVNDNIHDVMLKTGRAGEAAEYSANAARMFEGVDGYIGGGLFELHDRDLAIAYERRGEDGILSGDYDSAKDYFTKALKIFNEIFRSQEYPSIQSRFDLVTIWNNLGNLHMSTKEYEVAADYFNMAFKTDDELRLETRNQDMDIFRSEINVLILLGQTQIYLKDYSKVRTTLDNGIELAKFLYMQYKNTEGLKFGAIMLFYRGIKAVCTDDYESALEDMKQATKIGVGYYNQTDSVDEKQLILNTIIQALIRAGNCDECLGNIRDAESKYRSAYRCMIEFYKLSGGGPIAVKYAKDIIDCLTGVLEGLGDVDSLLEIRALNKIRQQLDFGINPFD